MSLHNVAIFDNSYIANDGDEGFDMPGTVVRTLPVSRLHKLLSYNRETGIFIWLQKPNRSILAGTEAGCVKPTGKKSYRYIRIDGLEIPAVRIAWAMHYGKWPQARLTFIDKDPLNLRIGNIKPQNHLVGHDHSSVDGRSSYLREYRSAFPIDWKNSHLKSRFGIDLADYSAMATAQDNKCAICGRPETATRLGKVKALAIDHCHDTGMIRGLLCVACNTGIGKLSDDPELLRAAADYIERHAERTDNVVFIKGKGATS